MINNGISDKLKVSIITVCYNSVATVEKTIQSVISQGYGNIEYIVIDGKSTDNTMEIVNKYAEEITCIICEEDDGLYDAMNKGIKIVTGDIVGIINSDDWYAPNIIQTVVKHFCVYNVDVIYGDIMVCDMNGNFHMQARRELEELSFVMSVPHPSVFIKREIYIKYGGFDTKYTIAADYELMLRLYKNKVKFLRIDAVISYFSLGGISQVRGKLCAEECKEISLKYLEQNRENENIVKKIESMYQKRSVTAALADNPNILEMALKWYYKDKSSIGIFGTGKYAKKCFDILKEQGVNVRAFWDNNIKLWGCELFGIKIWSPDALMQYSGEVLIAIRDFEAVKIQIERMNNKKLDLTYLDEIIYSYLLNNVEKL